jgi:hypothetical protein
MSEDGKKEDSSTQRWWEFYGIRYGMGTVTGGIILYFLFKSNALLKPLLFVGPDGKLEGSQLTLLAAYGLVYCYISSAPILVLHAGRFILNEKDVHWRIRSIFLIVLPSIIGIITYLVSADEANTKIICAVTAFMLSMITSLQLVFLVPSLLWHERLYTFYVRLASSRAISTGDLTNSYKHLREHGNSFFIVFLEFALGGVLYTASRYTFIAKESFSNNSLATYLLIIMLWMMPAVLVWLVGTLFEKNFVDAYKRQDGGA